MSMSASDDNFHQPLVCDIFCTVVDNYGDIGVSWRLSKQLAHEHDVIVRLWVDDLKSFKRLCPEINTARMQQVCQGVEVQHWTPVFPETRPADLVIEAFACKLPERYVSAMAAQKRPPVWVNLEHLSAEDWVDECHGLPSPHSSLPLVKYFFFPGFTPDTGGLLLERDLVARRDAFQRDPAAIEALWHTLGLAQSPTDEVRISLFCYDTPALLSLLYAWAGGDVSISCFVPEDQALLQVAQFFERTRVLPGEVLTRGNLKVYVLPFMEQARYDELLWVCDINFVRGEDSCIRAQWAAQPFVWHLYPQHDQVHIKKLRAFMTRYCFGLAPDTANALQVFWDRWNSGMPGTAEDSIRAWNDFMTHQSMLRQHAQAWALQLSSNTLALNLLNFYQKIDRMRATSDSKTRF